MTGNKKYKTRSEKLAARRRRRERRLEKIGAGGKYLANTKLAKPGSERQLLKQIFKTIKGASLTDKESRDLTTAIEKHLIDAEKADPTLRPKRFGVKTWAELAELSVRKFEQMETKARTFREFSANKFVRGSQGGVRGWLF